MPQAGKKGVPEREITSKAVKKQINRNANRSKMKGKVKNPEVRYVQDRNKKDDLTAGQKKKSKKSPSPECSIGEICHNSVVSLIKNS